MRGRLRLQQLLGDRVVYQANVALLGGHDSLLLWGGTALGARPPVTYCSSRAAIDPPPDQCAATWISGSEMGRSAVSVQSPWPIASSVGGEVHYSAASAADTCES